MPLLLIVFYFSKIRNNFKTSAFDIQTNKLLSNSMKKKIFFKELQKIFEIKKKINEDFPLNDRIFDSLKILEMISFQETYFQNLNIKPSDYKKCKKVGDLVKILKIKND